LHKAVRWQATVSAIDKRFLGKDSASALASVVVETATTRSVTVKEIGYSCRAGRIYASVCGSSFMEETILARLVVVSNRVPLPSQRGAQAGGLAVVLAEAMKKNAVWFGWSGQRTATASTDSKLQEAKGITYATIDLSEDDYQHYYAGFSNSALWPLLHLRTGLLNYHREDYDGYRRVNRIFAAALKPLLQDDDVIWVHDYQLFTLPEELRALGVKNRIGFFLHIPFVPSIVLQVLPPAAELLAAMCAADVIGFQTHRDRDSFFEATREILGAEADSDDFVCYNGCRVQVVVTPVGIDSVSFAKIATRAVRSAEACRLVESLAGRALAIGVDRLDYTKGLPNRFDAFSRLLSRYPQHIRQISFLQIAARSREDVDEYRDLRRELDRKIGDVNGTFSDFDWVPIRYMTGALKRKTLAGFFRVARIGLVTPLRDGMNLVAKEFVSAQNEEDPGVLILSRFAGAAEELSEALLVNPYDAEEMALAIHRALAMPLPERRERHGMLLRKTQIDTAASFCRNFLRYLAQ
jgi:trehalose 6-phosphate synthase